MQLKKISKLLGSFCSKCKEVTGIDEKYRCCDNTFCTITERGLEALGLSYENKNPVTNKAKYMGPKGCIVPIEHRPFCTSFACNMILKNRKLRREYDRIYTKLHKGDYMLEVMHNAPTLEELSRHFDKNRSK